MKASSAAATAIARALRRLTVSLGVGALLACGGADQSGTGTDSLPPAVEAALARGLVPVVTPLAVGPLNVNADEAAAALAVGLGAERLLFLTDVAGVFHAGKLLERIEAGHAETLIGEGRFEGGIVPKLLAAAQAARAGLVTEIGTTAVVA